MALKFILGNSGGGKTEYMYQEVVKAAEADVKRNYLVVVPEQFTMQTQRKLVDLSTNHAIMNIDVLSFQRLAYRIFDELGKTDIKILEETGKNLVLRRVAEQERDKLKMLGGNIHKMGYVGEVKSFLSELAQYNVTPETLQEFLAKYENYDLTDYRDNAKYASIWQEKIEFYNEMKEQQQQDIEKYKKQADIMACFFCCL